MRGRTAVIVIYPPTPTDEKFDDLGRRQGAEAPEGVCLRGAANPPRRVYRGEPIVTDIDTVAFLPAVQYVDGREVKVMDLLVEGAWAEVTEAKVSIQLGPYSIEARSGGQRVVRIDLKRIDRRDGSHGPL